MAGQFEQDFGDIMEPVIIGTMNSSKSSEGHMINEWSTLYTVNGVVQNQFTSIRQEVSKDTQIENDYLILLPLYSSSGAEIVIESGYEVQKGSSYSSTVPNYEIREHDILLDYVLEIEALRFERG